MMSQNIMRTDHDGPCMTMSVLDYAPLLSLFSSYTVFLIMSSVKNDIDVLSPPSPSHHHLRYTRTNHSCSSAYQRNSVDRLFLMIQIRTIAVLGTKTNVRKP